MTGAKYELWPVNDLVNMIASLELTGRNFGGEYGRGWCAALAALGVAIGAIPAPARSEPEHKPSTANVFDGVENVPFAIAAFARLK